MKILAVIAARGGSKGVKYKNIRMLAGKPLIAHSILQALRWGKFERLIVSTDSLRIASIARKFKAEVPFLRPKKLASDKAAKMDALRHALLEAEKHYALRFDALIDLDASSPVRRVKDIENIVRLFKRKKADCVFSAVKAHRNPYFNMVEVCPCGRAVVSKRLPEAIKRRQDAPEVYDMNASLYVYSRDFLLNKKNKSPYSGKSYIYEMPQASRFDIDSELDFKFLELLVKGGLVKF